MVEELEDGNGGGSGLQQEQHVQQHAAFLDQEDPGRHSAQQKQPHPKPYQQEQQQSPPEWLKNLFARR
jgi:hypothetical protein